MPYLRHTVVYSKSSFSTSNHTPRTIRRLPTTLPEDLAHQSNLPFPKTTSHKTPSTVFQRLGGGIPWCTGPIPTTPMAAILAPMTLERHK